MVLLNQYKQNNQGCINRRLKAVSSIKSHNIFQVSEPEPVFQLGAHVLKERGRSSRGSVLKCHGPYTWWNSPRPRGQWPWTQNTAHWVKGIRGYFKNHWVWFKIHTQRSEVIARISLSSEAYGDEVRNRVQLTVGLLALQTQPTVHFPSPQVYHWNN